VVKPVVQALLLADHVYEDRRSGKKVIAGVFRNLFFKRLEDMQAEMEKHGGKAIPGGMLAGSPYAYVSLTNVRGEQPFSLRYVDLEQDVPLFQTEFKVSCPDPLQVVELVFPLPPLPSTKAGVFALELVWCDDPIGYYRITVVEVPKEDSQDDSDGTN
jgi:hypothetical protein